MRKMSESISHVLRDCATIKTMWDRAGVPGLIPGFLNIYGHLLLVKD